MTVRASATATASAAEAVERGGALQTVERFLDREGVLGYLLMTPALLMLVIFIAYPFVLGVWYSMSDVKIIGLGDFIGLKNYTDLLQSPVFQQTVKNSFVYTGSATVFKLGLGLGLALIMNQAFPFRALIRASVLLP